MLAQNSDIELLGDYLDQGKAEKRTNCKRRIIDSTPRYLKQHSLKLSVKDNTPKRIQAFSNYKKWVYKLLSK